MSSNVSGNFRPAYITEAEELRDNPSQWEAYESTGNCVVLAGPGSGKTKVLTIKMARMLHEDVRPPQGIACITYSSECARELKRRLDTLGIEEKKNIYIGTIHSFCLNQIIRPYYLLSDLPISRDFQVADSQIMDQCFSKISQEITMQNRIKNITKTNFEKFRRTIIDRSTSTWNPRTNPIIDLIEKYEKTLHDAGVIDFDDMVLMGLYLIKKYEWVRKAIKSRFPILVIDEYQDLGLPLHEIVINLWQKAGVRFLAVGDPDQSIYGFNGAQPRLLHDLSTFNEIQKVTLKFNYRCGGKIIKGSKITLNQDRDYESKANHDGNIYFWECLDGLSEQAKVICDQIIPDILSNHNKWRIGDISILYLDKYDGKVITNAILDRKIKYIGGDKEIRYKPTPLTQWLEDCAAWCTSGWQIGKPRLSTLIRFWITLNELRYSPNENKTLRKNLVKCLWNQRNPEILLCDWLDNLISIGLLDAIDKSPTRTDEKESFIDLVSASKDKMKMKDFTIGAFGNLRGSPDYLNLITLHSSKGLENKAIIMMGLEHGRLPRFRAEDLDEERRKFYVGLTRAKHEVHLVYSGWYVNRYGTFKNGPSEYVIELLNKLEIENF